MNDKRRRFAMVALAGVFFVLFWVTSLGCGWFSDAPYLMASLEWPATIGSPRFFTLHEAALALAGAVFVFPAVVLLAEGLGPLPSPFKRLLDLVREDERLVPVLFTAIAIAGAAFVSYALVDHVKLIDDERAYLFEARLFAHGHVAAPAVPAALRNQMFITHPVHAGKYPPGNSALLAVGVLLGQPRLVHPLLAGVLVWATYSFTRRAFGRNVGMLACVLAALSPFLWCIDGTLMAFGTAGAALAVVLAGLARWVGGSRAAGVVAGAALGVLSATRYFEGAIVACSVGAWLLYLLFTKRIRWTSVVPMALGFFAVAWVPLWFNHALTGSMWKTGYALEGNPIRLGFGRAFIGTYQHTFARGVANVFTLLVRLDSWLLGLPGALVFVGIGLGRRGEPFDVLLRILFVVFFAAFVLVPAPGTWDVGPTYAFCVFPVLIALTARGFQSVYAFARGRLGSPVPLEWGALAFVALGAVTLTPLRLFRVEDLASAIQSPWAAVAESDVEGVVVVPPIGVRMAAGWGYGYPYELETKSGKTVHLAMPVTRAEYDEVMRHFGATSASTLVLDGPRFMASGERHFAVVPFHPAAAWPSPRR